jgi:hypothetical protein
MRLPPPDLARNGRIAQAIAVWLLRGPLALADDQQVIRIAADAYWQKAPRSFQPPAVQADDQGAGEAVRGAATEPAWRST